MAGWSHLLKRLFTIYHIMLGNPERNVQGVFRSFIEV